MRPNRLELCPIRKRLSYLSRRIGLCLLPFGDQLAIVETRYHLPFEDSPFLQPLRRVLSDHVHLVGNQPPDRFEQLTHRVLPKGPATPRATTPKAVFASLHID